MKGIPLVAVAKECSKRTLQVFSYIGLGSGFLRSLDVETTK